MFNMHSYFSPTHKLDQSTIWDVIVFIFSFRIDLSWPTTLVTGHYKEILSGFVVAFSYYVFSRVSSPVVMNVNKYILVHIG